MLKSILNTEAVIVYHIMCNKPSVLIRVSQLHTQQALTADSHIACTKKRPKRGGHIPSLKSFHVVVSAHKWSGKPLEELKLLKT